MKRKITTQMKTKADISDQISHIPDEILLEILIKLPPKSIYRFKCVSRNWYSLISHALFSPFYFSRSNHTPPFALVSQSNDHRGIHFLVTDLNNFSSPFPFAHIPGLKIKATSNDLILYQSNKDKSPYFVANPFTGQCVALPMHSERTSHGPIGLISCSRNGITNYNVVVRLIKHSNNCLNLETFSSETGEWTDIKAGISFTPDVGRTCIVFRDVLHWICDKTTAILAYDPHRSSPDHDRCRLISIPNGAHDANGMNGIVGAPSGNLCYFEVERIAMQESRLSRWKLWVLKDYESGEWSLERQGRERSIEGIGVVQGLLSKYSPLFPVAFHPWDKSIVYFLHEGYILNFSVEKGWFDDTFTTFSRFYSREIFPLSMPLCPTQIPVPQMANLAVVQ